MPYYDAKDRYQFQPWHIRLYRRLRWQPLSWFWFAWQVLKWAGTGLKRPEPHVLDNGYVVHDTRRFLFGMLWTVSRSWWTMRAGWWHTTEECMGRLRAAAPSK